MRAFLIGLASCALAIQCFCATYASNGTAADVQAKHTQAADGDTITLPQGVFVWSTGVTITKGVTIQGQTTTDSLAGTSNDLTVLQDSDTRRRPGGWPFITVNSVLGKSYRITGLTFDNGSAIIKNYNGAVELAGNSRAVRFDHNVFRSNLVGEATYVNVAAAQIWGVADHNVIKASIACFGFTMYGNGNGDAAFAAPTNFGGSNFFFVEDNYISSSTANPNLSPDDLRGGRWVFRHNHCFNSGVQSHGTEDGRWHGGRAREVYNNDFHNIHGGGLGGIRSGVTVFHDNTIDGQWPGDSMYQMQAYRYVFKWPQGPFGGATGDNPWDVNDPQTYASGTATSGDSTHLNDTTRNWTTNQWAGFTAKFVGNNQVALIKSNTATSLSVNFYTDSGGGHVWRAGDGYQVHKALVAMDQPCRGQGDLISGTPPINTVTGTASWPHQALEPSYSWNNIYTPDGRHINFTVGTGGGGGNNGENSQLLSGRDYFNDTQKVGYTTFTYPHPLIRHERRR